MAGVHAGRIEGAHARGVLARRDAPREHRAFEAGAVRDDDPRQRAADDPVERGSTVVRS